MTKIVSTAAPAIALPEMTLVVSSNLHSVGHDGTALFVRFLDKDGNPDRTYRFPTAPKMAFDEMLKAESPGRFFHSEISAKHMGERLR